MRSGGKTAPQPRQNSLSEAGRWNSLPASCSGQLVPRRDREQREQSVWSQRQVCEEEHICKHTSAGLTAAPAPTRRFPFRRRSLGSGRLWSPGRAPPLRRAELEELPAAPKLGGPRRTRFWNPGPGCARRRRKGGLAGAWRLAKGRPSESQTPALRRRSPPPAGGAGRPPGRAARTGPQSETRAGRAHLGGHGRGRAGGRSRGARPGARGDRGDAAGEAEHHAGGAAGAPRRPGPAAGRPRGHRAPHPERPGQAQLHPRGHPRRAGPAAGRGRGRQRGRPRRPRARRLPRAPGAAPRGQPRAAGRPRQDARPALQGGGRNPSQSFSEGARIHRARRKGTSTRGPRRTGRRGKLR